MIDTLRILQGRREIAHAAPSLVVVLVYPGRMCSGDGATFARVITAAIRVTNYCCNHANQ